MLAQYMDGFIDEKHANGFKYESEELILNRFDHYCNARGLSDAKVTKAFLDDWMTQTDTEGASYCAKRISVVRQFLLFLGSLGIQAYIPSRFCHFERSLPHLFDQKELESFFNKLDSYQPPVLAGRPLDRMHQEYRLLFRIYCCCGVRNSEACGIATKNVNLDNGVLKIYDSKMNKDRLVYMPDDLTRSCRDYHEWLIRKLGYEPDWFFPAQNPGVPLRNTAMDLVFDRFWGMTEYANCNNKPTIHDFRFTFVVRRMNSWAEEGLDLKVMIPYLSRYLGHKTAKETFYYYFLVNDAYRTVKMKDTYADVVIPEAPNE
ncbi:MAG: tyrosine-type recombinase/integrase [Lachnospiraceae bacterium]